MKTSLKLIEEIYNKKVPKWESKFYKMRYRKRTMAFMEENSTGYQITPFYYLLRIIKTLNKEFGVNPKQFNSMSLIDLGCGYGGLLAILSPYFKEVRGVEYNPMFVNFGKTLFNGNVNIYQGDVKYIVCKEDIIYTFNITDDKSIFLPILEEMRSGQILIESYGGNSIMRYAEALKFSKIRSIESTRGYNNGVIVQK